MVSNGISSNKEIFNVVGVKKSQRADKNDAQITISYAFLFILLGSKKFVNTSSNRFQVFHP
jgi:hypothetical protein